MDADPKSYVELFPVAERQSCEALPIFQAELSRRATFSWNDPPLDRSWTKPDATLLRRIEAGQGMLSERLALCQTIPLDEFLSIAEALRKSGYRPVRVRPYADGQTVRVAAVWTRDGRGWRIAAGLGPEELRRQDKKNQGDGFLPADVAGYVTKGARRQTHRPLCGGLEREDRQRCRLLRRPWLSAGSATGCGSHG